MERTRENDYNFKYNSVCNSFAGATQLKVSEITVKSLANYLKLDYSSLSEEEILELAMLLKTFQAFVKDYTDLNDEQIDEHETFAIAVFVLIQDMYDNRSLYIDKNNLNRVVDMILGMHSINLL